MSLMLAVPLLVALPDAVTLDVRLAVGDRLPVRVADGDCDSETLPVPDTEAVREPLAVSLVLAVRDCVLLWVLDDDTVLLGE